MGFKVVGDKLRAWGDNSYCKLGLPYDSNSNGLVKTYVDRPLEQFGMSPNVLIFEYGNCCIFIDGQQLWISGFYDSSTNTGYGEITRLSGDVDKVFHRDRIRKDNGTLKHHIRRIFFRETDGTLFGCGENHNGEIGCGSSDKFVQMPARIGGLAGRVVDVLIYFSVTYFVTDDMYDSVYACGRAEYYNYGRFTEPININGYEFVCMTGVTDRTHGVIGVMIIVGSGNAGFVVGIDKGGILCSGRCNGPNDSYVIDRPQMISLPTHGVSSIECKHGVLTLCSNNGIVVCGPETENVSGYFRGNGYLVQTFGQSAKPYIMSGKFAMYTSTPTANIVTTFNYGSTQNHELMYIRRTDHGTDTALIAETVYGKQLVMLNPDTKIIEPAKFIDSVSNVSTYGVHYETWDKPLYWCISNDYLYCADKNTGYKFKKIMPVQTYIRSFDNSQYYTYFVNMSKVYDITDTTTPIDELRDRGYFQNAHIDLGLIEKLNGNIDFSEIYEMNNITLYSPNGYANKSTGYSPRAYFKLWLPLNVANVDYKRPEISHNGNTNMYQFKYYITPPEPENDVFIYEIVDHTVTAMKKYENGTPVGFSDETIRALKDRDEYRYATIVAYDSNGYHYSSTPEFVIVDDIEFDYETNQIGTKYGEFTFDYSVSHTNNKPISGQLSIDNNVIETFETVSQNTINTITITDEIFQTLKRGQNILKLRCSDGSITRVMEIIFSRGNNQPWTTQGDIELGEISQLLPLNITAMDKDSDELDIALSFYYSNGDLIKTVRYMKPGQTTTVDLSSAFNSVTNGYNEFKYTITDVTRVPVEYKISFTKKPGIVFSNYSEQLGGKSSAFSCSYTVNSTTELPLSGEILLDDVVIDTIETVPQNTANTIEISEQLFQPLSKTAHRITVRCSDGENTEQVEMNFTRINNAPSIDENIELGEISQLQPFNLTVRDRDMDDILTLVIKDNGTIIKTYSNLKNGDVTSVNLGQHFEQMELGNHELEATVSDSIHSSDSYITFTKIEGIVFSNYVSDLGDRDGEFNCTYSVANTTGLPLFGQILLDNNIIETIETVPQNTINTVTITDETFQMLSKTAHKITVRCSDDTTARDLEINFTKVNSTPSIKEGNVNLGEIYQLLPFNLTVVDKNVTDTLTLTIKKGASTIKTYSGLKNNSVVSVDIGDQFESLPIGSNTFTAVVSDGENSSTNTISLNKVDRKIIFSNYSVQLGEKDKGFECRYSVRSTLEQQLSGEVLLNGYVIETIETVSQNTINTITITDELFQTLCRSGHKLSVRCTDGEITNGIEMNFTKTVGELPTPPVISGVDEDLGTLSITGPVLEYSVLSSNAGGPLNVKISINNVQVQTHSADVGKTYSYSTGSGLSVGKHSVEITVTDRLGSRSTRYYTFTIEISAPVISGVNSHLGDVSIAPTIQYTIYDESDTEKRAKVELNNTIISDNIIESGTQYTYTPDFESLDNGQHTVKITATNSRAQSVRLYTFNKIDRDIVFYNYTHELGVKGNGFNCNYSVINTNNRQLSGEILLDEYVIERVDFVMQNAVNVITISEGLFQSLSKTNHKITVRCTDGMITREINIRFTRGNNGPTVQQGDMHLGEISQLLPFDLTVVDGDINDRITLIINSGNTVLKTFSDLKNGDTVGVDIRDDFKKLPAGNGVIDVIVTDGEITNISKITFNKIDLPFDVEMDPEQIGEILYELRDIKYTVNGDNGEQFSMNLIVDGEIEHTVVGIQNGIEFIYSCPQEIIDSIEYGERTIVLRFISATTGRHVSIDFNVRKVHRKAEFTGKNTLLSSRASRIFFSSIYKLAPRASLTVFATNNAGDGEPVWENATEAFMNGDYHIFSNRDKTTSKYIVNIKVIIDVGTSREYSYISKLMYSVD